MSLTYITITESFVDGTGAPLSANVTLTPSQAVYAGGIPVVTPASPIVAEVVGGQLLGPSGGPLTLLANVQSGLTLMSGTGFWWWQVTVQVGQVTDTWQFQLAASPSSVELYSTKNSPAIQTGYLAAKSGSTTIPFGEISPQVVALTDAATILVNAALGNELDVTLGGNRTVGAPSSPVNGQRLTFRVRQPASGGPWTLTWTGGAGGYSFGAGSAPTLSTAASACDLLAFDYDSTKNQWMSLGSVLGF